MADAEHMASTELEEALEACDQRIADIRAEKRAIAAERSRRHTATVAEQVLAPLTEEQRNAVIELATLHAQAKAQSTQAGEA